jgi:hypothetical protein
MDPKFLRLIHDGLIELPEDSMMPGFNFPLLEFHLLDGTAWHRFLLNNKH